jgi:pimeloyl-[acyl-carrier protein] synthase
MSLVTLDLRDPAYRENPYPTLARARADNPVHQDTMGVWYVTRHADIVPLLRDPRLGRDLRKWMGYPLLRPYLADTPLERCIEQWMFSLDPPEHTRLRQLVARAFTPRAVAAMAAAIEEVADGLLADLRAEGATELDLLTAFAQPFPVRVIARVLGLPIEIYDDLKRWSTDVALAMEPTSRRRDRMAANEAAIQLMAYLREQVANRRERRDGDVISLLVAAADDGDKLSEEELISQLVLLFIAGHETTTNLLGNGMLALCRNPHEMARLRDDPSLAESAIEEMLRYESPANTNARVAHEDIEVGGKVIGAGQIMLCMLGSANRDPAAFPDPDRFDIGRTPNAHLSFGGGVHYCIGAPLARLEGRIALEETLRRFPEWTFVEDDAVRLHTSTVRGYSSVPLAV